MRDKATNILQNIKNVNGNQIVKRVEKPRLIVQRRKTNCKGSKCIETSNSKPKLVSTPHLSSNSGCKGEQCRKTTDWSKRSQAENGRSQSQSRFKPYPEYTLPNKSGYKKGSHHKSDYKSSKEPEYPYWLYSKLNPGGQFSLNGMYISTLNLNSIQTEMFWHSPSFEYLYLLI